MKADEYWALCQRELPGATTGRTHRVKCFGAGQEMSRLLLELIASRQKTGTFALLWEFEAQGVEPPAQGDLFVVTDAAGEAGALIRISEARVLRFDEIGAEEVACEGPSLREVGPWRELHWAFWTRLLAGIGREPAPDMPVLFQRFELLHTPGNNRAVLSDA